MADVSRTVAIIFQGQDNVSASLTTIEKSLQSVQQAAQGAGGTASQEIDKIGTAAAKTAGSADVLTNAMKALAASLVFKAFVDANVELEKFERSMTLLTGSSTEAGKAFDYITGLSRTLGLNVLDTANNFIQLTAATKGTTLEGQATKDIFEAVSKAMATLGKSSADTSGALLAITQMVSKGTVSMEELRGQLGERLPGAFQTAAKAMGLTTAALGDLVASGKLTTEEFLPKFAAALKDTFGDTSFVDGYAASLNRLQNSVTAAFIEIGKSGAFEALTKTVELGTAAVVGFAAQLKLVGTFWGILVGAIASGDFSQVASSMAEALDKAGNSTRKARDDLLGYTAEAEAAKKATEEAGGSINLFATDVEKYLAGLAKPVADLNANLKALGLDPKKFALDAGEIIGIFTQLTLNPLVRGDEILAGLKKTLTELQNSDQVAIITQQIITAFTDGKISATQYQLALGEIQDKQLALAGSSGKVTDTVATATKALEKAALESKKLEEQTAKTHLELEKLASNERIKLIEAKVTLNVAQIQADAQKVIAAFESINKIVEGSNQLLGDLFKLLGAGNLDWNALRLVEDQIKQENDIKRDQLALQKELIQAQVANLNAQTANLLKGDAIIKIDGAGLQPQLEAFMWEILKAIQVRVNQQGLGLLLGV